MSTSLTPSERTLLARMAAHVRWSRHDADAHCAMMRAAGLAGDERWLDQVDSDRQLSEAKRRRRAEHAKVAYFTGLALKSARARRERAEARRNADGGGDR